MTLLHWELKDETTKPGKKMIFENYQKKSESPSEILFADLVKTRIKPYEDPVKFPVALKVFVDLEKVDKDTLTQKEKDIYDENIYDIIGIKYEAKMYKKIYKLIIDGICPNFIPYVGFAECTKDEILNGTDENNPSFYQMDDDA